MLLPGLGSCPEYRAALGVRIHNIDHIEAVHCRKVGVFNDGLIIAADEVRQADTAPPVREYLAEPEIPQEREQQYAQNYSPKHAL